MMPQYPFILPQTLAQMVAQARYQPTGRSQSVPVIHGGGKSSEKMQQFKAEIDLAGIQRLLGKDPESIKRKQAEAMVFAQAYSTLKMIDPNAAEAMKRQFEPKFEDWSEHAPFFYRTEQGWQVAPVAIGKEQLESALTYLVGPELAKQWQSQIQQPRQPTAPPQPELQHPTPQDLYIQKQAQMNQPTQQDVERLVEEWSKRGYLPFSHEGEPKLTQQQPVQQQVGAFDVLASLPSIREVTDIRNINTAVDMFFFSGKLTADKIRATKEGALLNVLDTITRNHPLVGYTLTTRIFQGNTVDLSVDEMAELIRKSAIASDPYYDVKNTVYLTQMIENMAKAGTEAEKQKSERAKQAKMAVEMEKIREQTKETRAKTELTKEKIETERGKQRIQMYEGISKFYDSEVKRIGLALAQEEGLTKEELNEVTKTLEHIGNEMKEILVSEASPENKLSGVGALGSTLASLITRYSRSKTFMESAAKLFDSVIANYTMFALQEGDKLGKSKREAYVPGVKTMLSNVVVMAPYLEPRAVANMVPIMKKFGFTEEDVLTQFVKPIEYQMSIYGTTTKDPYADQKKDLLRGAILTEVRRLWP